MWVVLLFVGLLGKIGLSFVFDFVENIEIVL